MLLATAVREEAQGVRMLSVFLQNNRTDLIGRCRAKVVARSGGAVRRELEHGITVFLDQLIETLRMERAVDPQGSPEEQAMLKQAHEAAVSGQATAGVARAGKGGKRREAA